MYPFGINASQCTASMLAISCPTVAAAAASAATSSSRAWHSLWPSWLGCRGSDVYAGDEAKARRVGSRDSRVRPRLHERCRRLISSCSTTDSATVQASLAWRRRGGESPASGTLARARSAACTSGLTRPSGL
eukprot:scaffold597_cov242-Prasinococcus_capsulatus_cf.AAC.10